MGELIKTIYKGIYKGKKGTFYYRTCGAKSYITGFTDIEDAKKSKDSYHAKAYSKHHSYNCERAKLLGIKVSIQHRPFLKKHSWHINSSGYAETQIKRKRVLLHSLILPYKKGYVTDHKSSEKLDNRITNLRYATPAENSYNRKKAKNNISGYTGVYKKRYKWEVQIGYRGHKLSLGAFMCKHKAAMIRDKEAAKLFGDFFKPQMHPGFTCI